MLNESLRKQGRRTATSPGAESTQRRLKVRRKKKSSCRKSKLELTPVEQRLGETRRPVKHMVLHVFLNYSHEKNTAKR